MEREKGVGEGGSKGEGRRGRREEGRGRWRGREEGEGKHNLRICNSTQSGSMQYLHVAYLQYTVHTCTCTCTSYMDIANQQ